MAPLDRTPSVVTEPESRGAGVGPGTMLGGRYAVGDRLGEGGMAWVYLAYDVRLQRSVAVKILKAHADGAAETRILREARAMAQLGHPNVLPVFDVGNDEGRSFIVMEYVAGVTLRAWTTIAPRTRAELLRVLAGAARGLEAAHAAGFVHRDFKPANVMVDRTGRARVMDFGLVRNESSPSSSGTRTIGGVTVSLRGLDRLTTTGTVMGTPAYMSPEQHGSDAVDARSDQYGFCVALYEALLGELPFTADTMAQLLARKWGGAAGLPPLARLPKAIAALVVRGLDPDPAARHRSMGEIAEVLERQAARVGRPWLVAGGIAAACGAAFWGAAFVHRPVACDGGPERLAGVWDDGRREALVAALGSVDVGFARTTAEATATRLDAWRSEWLAGYEDACTATHVRREQSPERLDARVACLNARRGEASALVDVLLDRPDRATVEHAVDAVASLDARGGCDAPDDDDAVKLDPALQSQADEVLATLAQVRSLDLAARYADATRVAADAVAAAARLDHAPLLAEAHLVRSRVRRDAGDPRGALADLDRAGALAVVGRDDALMRSIALDAIEIHADYLESAEQAKSFVTAGRAWIERAGAPAVERSRFALGAASAERRAGDLEAAVSLATEAVAAIDREHGTSHPLADKARNVLALALSDQGRWDEARRWLTEVRELRIARLGGEHPHVAQAENSLASLAIDEGQYAAAKPLCEHAVEVGVAALGEQHPEVANYLVNRALAYEGLGDVEGALVDLRRAQAIQEATLGPEHAAVGRTLLNAGTIEVRTLGPLAASVTLERARSILTSALGDGHLHVEFAEAALGQVLQEAGRLDEARGHLERAVRKAEARTTMYDPHVLSLRLALVGLAHESGRFDDAAHALDDMLARLASPECNTLRHARVRLELGKLTEGYFPKRTDDARALVRSAVAIYDAHPDAGDPAAEEARKVLARVDASPVRDVSAPASAGP
jgi:tetratricopeptide (TPR) repeat protein/predicted Ser/Thr protein kinase